MARIKPHYGGQNKGPLSRFLIDFHTVTYIRLHQANQASLNRIISTLLFDLPAGLLSLALHHLAKAGTGRDDY